MFEEENSLVAIGDDSRPVEVAVVVDEKGPGCIISLHVRDLPIYDYREALRPPTRFLPLEEEEYEEEG